MSINSNITVDFNILDIDELNVWISDQERVDLETLSITYNTENLCLYNAMSLSIDVKYGILNGELNSFLSNSIEFLFGNNKQEIQ